MAWIRYASIAAALVAFAGAAVAAPAGHDAGFTRAAAAAVERIECDDGFSGVILVARGNQVLLRKAAGYADRERNIRNTPDTKFHLESVTKQFTATAIMLLVDEGKVSLDDPISKYYPASPATWSKVTIRHLLTHGSGIEDYWVHRHEPYAQSAGPEQWRSRGDHFRAVQNDPPAFDPGTAIEYSNAGYALLAEVIERVTGERYDDFLSHRIFTPLGMRDSGFGLIPGIGMKGYVRSFPDGVWQNARPDGVESAEVAVGAGGLYSTLDDMLIWSRAQDTDKLLSPKSRAAMYTDYGHAYGFGVRFAPKFGRKLIWHTGNDEAAGFAAIFDRFPQEQLTVVAMTNNTGVTGSNATLLIEGQLETFPANAMRKAVEEVERLYFGSEPQ